MKRPATRRLSLSSRLRRFAPRLELLEDRSSPTSLLGALPAAAGADDPAAAGITQRISTPLWDGLATGSSVFYLDASVAPVPSTGAGRYNGGGEVEGAPAASSAVAAWQPQPPVLVTGMADPLSQDVLAASALFGDPLRQGAAAPAHASPAPSDPGQTGGTVAAAAEGPALDTLPLAPAAMPPTPTASVSNAGHPALPADLASLTTSAAANRGALPSSVRTILPGTPAPLLSSPSEAAAPLAGPPAGSNPEALTVPPLAPSAGPVSGASAPTAPVLSSPSPAAPSTATLAASANPRAPIIVTGSDAGSAPWVKVFDADTGQEKFQFLAYASSFTGGVRVAAADLTGDGIPDIVTAPGPGMAPEVKAFDGTTGAQLPGPVGDFLAYDPSFTGGVFVAAGDVNGDYTPDILTGPGLGGGSQVRAFSGKDGSLLTAFAADGPGYESGVPLAAAYWQGVGHAYVVTGTGPGAPAEVQTFDPQTGNPVPGPLGDFDPYEPGFRGGVWVAAADVNGDSQPDILTGPGAGHAPEVKVYSGQDGSVLQDYLAGSASDRSGVRVASTYVDTDWSSDVVTTGGPGTPPQVSAYSGATGQPLPPPEGGFLAGDPAARTGLFVAAAIDPTTTVTVSPATQQVLVGQAATITVSWTSDMPNPSPGSSGVGWGDNSGNTPLFPSGDSGSATASHAYAAAGTYTITATVALFNPSYGYAVGTGTATVVVTGPPKALVPTDQCTCSDPGAGVLSNAPALAGPTPSDFSDAPVRYADGVVQLGASDLAADGFGVPWGQSRSWTNGAGYAAGSDNGNGWVDAQAPRLLQADGSTNNSLVLVTDGTTARYYDLSGGAYQPRFFDQSQLVANTTTHEFVLTDTNGNVLHFADFSSGVPAAERGALKSYVDSDGNTINVTSWTMSGQPAEVQRTTSSGSDTITESYLYAYVSGGANLGLLAGVTLRRQTNGGAWSVVRQVQYTYYDGTQPYGNKGDLELAQVLDGAGNVLDTDYYRYYTSADAGTIGYVHGLKYAFGPDSYARLVADLGGTAPGAATDSQVAAYADHYFEYDGQQRVTKEVAQGLGCSSCSGGLGTYTYAYTASSNAAGMNSWATKTVVTLPDGNQDTAYTNAYGEQMLLAYTDATSQQTWLTFTEYDSQGQVILQANPSAVTGYSDSYADLLHSQSGNYQYLSDGSGLIQLTDYYTSTTATATTPGGAAGYVQGTKAQQGELGTPVLQSSTQYYAQTAGGATIYPTATQTAYRNTDGTGAETTSYAYTWFSGTDRVQSETVTQPVISAAENGPGVADTATTFFDSYGRPIWQKDGDGFLTYTAYDPATGAVVKTITDVDTTRTGDFQNLPSGWNTPAGGGLNLVTTYQVDGLGRTTEETDPDGNITYTVYNDPNYEVLVYPGWNSTTGMPTGPTEVTRQDQPGSYTETFTMSAAPHMTNGVPDGTEAVSGLQSLSRSYTNAAGQVVREDDYFALSGVTYSTAQYIGTQNSNYYTTQYAYDSRGRENRVQTPTGTIKRTVYDGLGRVVSTWVGTNDTPGSGYWSPSNNTAPSNMVQVTADTYDGGGVGDGDLTQQTQYPGGGAAARVEQDWYDWRDRLVATKQGVQATEDSTTHRPVTYTTLDNLGEAVTQQQYDGDGVTLTTTGGVPQPPSASLLRAQTTSSYDEQGRAYQTQVFDVNQSTGAVSSTALTSNTWFNHRGLVIKTAQPGGLVSKTAYDGAGRATVEYTTDGGGDSTWADAGNVTGDAVLSQVETAYDADGNAILTTDRERFHNETTTGALGNPTTAPKARVSYVALYYDAANRLTTTVNVGTNGGTAWTRPSTPPAASDTVLVTIQQYNPAGWVSDVIDPRGIDTRTAYDPLGRTTQTVEDYTDGTPTNNTNKTTDYTYDGDGHQLTVTAVGPGGSVETTQYVYGATTTAGSDVNSNDILAAVQYPDPTTGQPSSSLEETYTVNALGQNLTYQDRNGTVHTYTYDVLGRQTADAVTTLAAGVDGAVLRLETAYDTGDRPYLYTSYNAASGGSVVNQVEDVYNGLGQLVTEYQSHSGAVNTSTTPSVQYAYTEMSGGQNNSRLVSMTYPNGRVLDYNYNTGLDSSISRLSALSDSSGTLESYLYLGLGTVVERDHPQDGVNLTYIQQTGDMQANHDGGDQYTGLDRFGRVIDQFWINAGTGQATDRFQYGYDRDGNVLYKNNLVDAAFSELYHASGAGNGYDNLNQLAAFERGTLSASQQGGPLDTVAIPSHSQSWVYDALGNWSSVTTDGVAQTRTANQQNEITSISGQTTPGYDANGNTTTDQTGHTLVYDAWNRLVGYKSGGTTLTAYGYDALGRRITENPGALRDLYYSSAWQVLEERVGADVQDQYVWSPVYVDALVERDRDPTGGGTLSERLYAQQDANWNVTAVVSTAGAVQERDAYDPYGQASVLGPDWSTRGSTLFAWQYGYQGGRYDVVDGLVHFGIRDYSSALGRWEEADPLKLAAGDNDLYRFVANEPPSANDPTGEVTAKVTRVDLIQNTNDIPKYAKGFKFPPIPTSERRVPTAKSTLNDLGPSDKDGDFYHGVWVIFEGSCLKDLKFMRTEAQSVKTAKLTQPLTSGGGYKEGQLLSANSGGPDGPAAIEVKLEDTFAIIADQPGFFGVEKGEYPMYDKMNFHVTGTSKTDGKVKGEIWYDIVIEASGPGDATTNTVEVTKTRIS